MNSTDAPLWDDDAKDIIPQFQLSYGRILCEAQLTERAITRMARYLDLGVREYAGPIDYERLPVHRSAGCRTLGTPDNVHLLVAPSGPYHVVFGSHSLFLNNERWIKWNKRTGGLLAVATQLDERETYYCVFEAGERLLSVCTKAGQLTCLEEPAIEVHLGGELIYSEAGSQPQMSHEVADLLQHDLRIIDDGNHAVVSRAFSQQVATDVTHVVFRRNPRRKWFVLLRPR
jgi:hypothetical protein